MPAPMMRETHSPASSARRKADQHGARGLGLLQDAHRHFGDDAEQPLRAGDDADQVVAAGVEMLAAEPEHLAGHQHHFEAEDVVGGHAVFQAMHAAGILRDVAADGAGDLRRGVGRVVEGLVLDRLADGEIGDARLDHGDAVGEVDLADAVELAHAEQHAVDQRQRPAGQRGARPARHHPDAVVVAIAQHARPPGRWSRAAPPPSEAACRRSARRIRKGRMAGSDDITPSPGTISDKAATISLRRARTAWSAAGIRTDMCFLGLSLGRSKTGSGALNWRARVIVQPPAPGRKWLRAATRRNAL